MSCFRIGTASAILLAAASAASAAPEAYMVNLGPVARTNATKLIAVGRGTADVIVDGRTLTLNGQFSGLASPATDALLCIGRGIGTPGTCDTDTVLKITRDVSGMVSGTVALNAQQMAALPAGRLYLQINSLKARAGNLWGWIMTAHEEVGQDVPQQGHWFLPQYDMPKSVEHGSTHPLAADKNS